ncbi:MAG: GNAT family N-acetyltransferase [Labilithrix sp.]|nr:GNAT family N-acetyltransferase [Labilithrix sp.]
MSLASSAPAPASLDDPAFSGDPAWRVTRALRDGTLVVVRPVTPDDREELRRGFLELSPESLYFRFLHVGAMPTDDLLTYLTSVDQKDHVAIGATLESPDLKTERGVGIARFVRLEGVENTAEAAITVVDDMHRRGVATVLLRELLRAAKVRGIQTLRAEVLADNDTMRAILERAGAARVLAESGEGTIAYDLTIGDERQAEKEPSLFEVLRGAAETMALRFRR